MRTLVFAALAAASAVTALPALAQDHGYRDRYDDNRYDRDRDNYDGRDDGTRRGSDIGQLRYEVNRAIQNGELSWQQRDYFRRQLDYIYRLDSRYRSDGYTGWEQRDMERRTDQMMQYLDQVRTSRNDYGRYYDRTDRDWDSR